MQIVLEERLLGGAGRGAESFDPDSVSFGLGFRGLGFRGLGV